MSLHPFALNKKAKRQSQSLQITNHFLTNKIIWKILFSYTTKSNFFQHTHRYIYIYNRSLPILGESIRKPLVLSGCGKRQVVLNGWSKNKLFFPWRGPLSYSNQFTDLQSKSMDWFLHDRDLRHEIAKTYPT